MYDANLCRCLKIMNYTKTNFIIFSRVNIYDNTNMHNVYLTNCINY